MGRKLRMCGLDVEVDNKNQKMLIDDSFQQVGSYNIFETDISVEC